MLDLDESLRALYFAPYPLLVLDHTRYIRMINKAAEIVLGTSGPSALGVLFEKFVSAGSRMSYNASMNDAAEVLRANRVFTTVSSTRLSLVDADSSAIVSVDMSTTAWFPTSEMYDSVVHRSNHAMNLHSPSGSTADFNAAPPPMQPIGNGGEKRFQPAHEAFYTLSLMPARAAPSERSSTPDPEVSASTLRNCAVDSLDQAIIVLSKDAKRFFRNTRADELLAEYIRELPADEDDDDDQEPAPLGPGGMAEERTFEWLDKMMTAFVGETFDEPLLGVNFPIYRSAVKGERVLPMEIECVSQKTGFRKRFEVEGKPLRDMGGLGKHVSPPPAAQRRLSADC